MVKQLREPRCECFAPTTYQSGIRSKTRQVDMSDPEHTLPYNNPPRLYAASVLILLFLLAYIVFIWFRVYNAPPPIEPGETVVTNRAEITQYLNDHSPQAKPQEGPFYIPTGVVVQALEFKGPYTIQASGYVWQRYGNTLPNLDRGVVFPEADTTTMTKLYETTQGDELLVGWNFKTTLRQQFDYTKYPLDRQQIWLRMWHIDFERSVYLTPDVEGYASLDPSTSPGLDSGLVLENWTFSAVFLVIASTGTTPRLAFKTMCRIAHSPKCILTSRFGVLS
jgi:hypothetical protein